MKESTLSPTRASLFSLRLNLSTTFKRILQIMSSPRSLSLNGDPQHSVEEEAAQVYSGSLTPLIQDATRRLASSEHYQPPSTDDAPYGHFRGRPIIGESTQVNGGIYVGHSAHEAVVVDEKYGMLRQVLRRLREEVDGVDRETQNFDYEIFKRVVKHACETIRWDPDGARDFTEDQQVGKDQKIALDVFITKRIGDCRHQVLLAAYLIEQLIHDGIVSGTITLESILYGNSASSEALLYTSENGASFRFDPLQYAHTSQVH